MKLKNYRYGHQQRCQGGIENKPVKPHTKARAKPKAQPIVQDVEEEIPQQTISTPQLTQPVKKQILKPTNPLTDITNHYQLLQQQYIHTTKTSKIPKPLSKYVFVKDQDETIVKSSPKSKKR